MRIPMVTCEVCTGALKPGFSRCYNCEFTFGSKAADQLGFISYAWHPHQTGTTMRGYKAPYPAPSSRQAVELMISYAVVGHWSCMTDAVHGPVASWATVPSLPKRSSVHPLRELALTTLSGLPEVEVSAADPLVGRPRDFVPGNFVVPSAAGHVLLIDDTWASGGHVQSAAAALKKAGASRVTALLLARWLEPQWYDTQTLINRLIDDFDPDICPFTSEHC